MILFLLFLSWYFWGCSIPVSLLEPDGWCLLSCTAPSPSQPLGWTLPLILLLAVRVVLGWGLDISRHPTQHTSLLYTNPLLTPSPDSSVPVNTLLSPFFTEKQTEAIAAKTPSRGDSGMDTEVSHSAFTSDDNRWLLATLCLLGWVY